MKSKEDSPTNLPTKKRWESARVAKVKMNASQFLGARVTAAKALLFLPLASW